MNGRFLTGKSGSYMRNVLLSILLFIIVFAVFTAGINRASSRTADEEAATLEAALTRSITHCYAIEGQYPESLDYLKSHYGLTYNEDRFYVDYQPLGSDILPDVTIIKKGESSE